jgi:hypothetical protein
MKTRKSFFSSNESELKQWQNGDIQKIGLWQFKLVIKKKFFLFSKYKTKRIIFHLLSNVSIKWVKWMRNNETIHNKISINRCWCRMSKDWTNTQHTQCVFLCFLEQTIFKFSLILESWKFFMIFQSFNDSYTYLPAEFQKIKYFAIWKKFEMTFLMLAFFIRFDKFLMEILVKENNTIGDYGDIIYEDV